MGGEPIHILDEIAFGPGQRASFLAALEKRYRPKAEALGLRLRSLWLEPPIDVTGVASRALIDWELDDVAAFWSWRQRGIVTPDLVAFWSDAAPQIARRVRRYAGSVGSAGLDPFAPAPEVGRASPSRTQPLRVLLDYGPASETSSAPSSNERSNPPPEVRSPSWAATCPGH